MTNSLTYSRPAKNPKKAPGPRGIFFFGSSFDFQRDPLDFILNAARQYGPVVNYQIANIQMYQVNHPAGIQRVLVDNNRNYIKGSYWDAIRQVGGHGLLSSEGSLWQRQRRLIQPAFHRQRVAGFSRVMVDCTLQMLEGWEQVARSGEPLDIYQEFSHLTMRVITEALFGSRLEGKNQALSSLIHLLLEDMYFRFEVPLYPKMNIPTFRNLRAKRALRVLDEMIYRIIRSRQQEAEERNDLLSMLMAARDEDTGEAMSEKQLRDELVTLFIAGQETTALLLSWFFHLLSQQPEWEDRLVTEIDQVLHDHLPAAEDLSALPTLRMAIDETLRFYPSIWMTTRTCLKDDEVCGIRIPAGGIVGLPPYVIHRLPEFWPDPEKFDPLRFTPENSAGRARFAYMPFGAGQRLCIGNSFALVQSQLVSATLIHRYRLSAIPGRSPTTRPLLTLQPRAGVWMRVEKR